MILLSIVGVDRFFWACGYWLVCFILVKNGKALFYKGFLDLTRSRIIVIFGVWQVRKKHVPHDLSDKIRVVRHLGVWQVNVQILTVENIFYIWEKT